jgi:hypothetical protein
MEVVAFFEREEGSREGFPAESYAAGFRQPDGKPAVRVTLPAETVERVVLTGARLSLWLCLDGRLVLDGEGVSDDVLEAAGSAGPLGRQTLASLVSASLRPDELEAEEDPIAGLSTLRAQLADALVQVDGAIERLRR